jgi:CRISP-associated protein Cas1
MTYIPLKPIPLKDRVSMVFVEYGQIDVQDGAFVVIDKTGIRTHIPVGSTACILLEPGTRVSHAAIKLAATVGTLLVWVGEAGVRLYARDSLEGRAVTICCIRLVWRLTMTFG